MGKLPTFIEELDEDYVRNLTKVLDYAEKINDLTSIDINSGPMYMRDFNVAYELTAKVVSKLQEMLDNAILNRKHEESKAQLERAPRYFEENDITGGSIKDSSSLRSTYVNLDENYRKAKERENALKAFVQYLNNKMDSFKMAHDDAKKIYDKCAEGPFGRTGHNNGPKSSS